MTITREMELDLSALQSNMSLSADERRRYIKSIVEYLDQQEAEETIRANVHSLLQRLNDSGNRVHCLYTEMDGLFGLLLLSENDEPLPGGIIANRSMEEIWDELKLMVDKLET